MRFNTTTLRLISGAAFAVVLGGGLMVAERANEPAAPVDIDSQSIALSFPSLPKLPGFSSISALPKLSLPEPTAPALTGLPGIGSISPQNHGGFALPGHDAICQALLNAHAGIYNTPPSIAREAALALNLFYLALNHCVVLSGQL